MGISNSTYNRFALDPVVGPKHLFALNESISRPRRCGELEAAVGEGCQPMGVVECIGRGGYGGGGMNVSSFGGCAKGTLKGEK